MRSFQIKLSVLFAALGVMTLAGGCGNSALKDNELAYKTIGITAMEQGEYEDAVAAFQNALDQSLAVVGPDEIDICYYKAMAQYKAGHTGDAMETYTALIDYDSKNADAYYLRGTLYLDQGMGTEALADYGNAVKYDSKNLEMYLAVYENLSGAGYETEGLEILKQAAEVSGSKADDYARRGRVYTLLGDYGQAEMELEKAAEEGSTEAILYMGQLLEEQGNAEEAQTYYENYISLNEDDADALNTLGCMAMEKQNYDTALSYFQKALEAAETSGVSQKEILKNEILAYEYTGQFQEAKTAMEEYAESYTVEEDFMREYEFLQTR